MDVKPVLGYKIPNRKLLVRQNGAQLERIVFLGGNLRCKVLTNKDIVDFKGDGWEMGRARIEPCVFATLALVDLNDITSSLV